MEKNRIIDEIDLCNKILEKFKDEMIDCKKDFELLKSLQPKDGDNPHFKKALLAVKERHDDITMSVNLIKNRIKKLKEDLNEV